MYRDKEIRPLLIKLLLNWNKTENNPLIIEELGLCQGDVRVDVAVINGSLNGYEIKSENDTLRRLPKQKEIYCKIFDTVTLISTKKHIKKVYSIVPSWWGINEVVEKHETIEINQIRKPKVNKSIDPELLVQLLWRDEALEILKNKNLHKGLLSKSRNILWEKIVDNLTIDELKQEVRTRIKIRHNWQSGPKHRLNGD